MKEREGRKESGLLAILRLGLDSLKLGVDAMKSIAQACIAVFPVKSATPSAPVPESGRDEDRDLETELEFDRDERWGTLLVVCAFLVTVAGGIGFLLPPGGTARRQSGALSGRKSAVKKQTSSFAAKS